ncbi:DNA-directed RNA polymerase I subunit rpa49 [Rhodotorula toruloides]
MADSAARKRQKGLQGQAIEVQLAANAANAPQPALALFPSAQPPSKTPYTLYTKSGEVVGGDGRKRQQAVLAAETDDVEFESRNQLGVDEHGEGEGYSVQYMLGVRNPRTNILTLHAAPLHTFTPTVKSLKSAPTSQSAAQLIAAQRAALGSTFGTKKAIKQLRAQERNKLNETSFGVGSEVAGLKDHLTLSIQAAAGNLPSMQSIEDEANEKRPIPPYNKDAKSPGEVYDIDAVVSQAELDAVPLGDFISAPDFKARRDMLPYRRSDFIATKMRQLLPSRASAEGNVPNPSKRDRERLRLVVHLSHLFQFRNTARPGQLVDRTKLAERLGNPSNAVVDALLERYTEKVKGGAGGEEARKVTTTMELKLLTYMLVVALKLDGWSTDVETMAKDLGMGTKRVGELFRSLGCQLIAPSAADREKLVATGRASSAAEAAKSKKATLKVPLQFPKERKGQPKR